MKAALAGLAGALALALAASTAAADPIGALLVSGDLRLTGGGPTQRVTTALTVFLPRRWGVYAAASQVTTDGFGDDGLATAGVAYRAASARPKLELVVHGDVGVSWGGDLAPAIGGGVQTYLWPLKKVPVALVPSFNVYAVLDGVDDSRTAFALGLGLALAR